MIETYSIVYVAWADAHTSEAGWIDLDEYSDEGEAMVHTVGFLIPIGQPGSKEQHVSLWQSISDDDAIHGFHIPVAMVRDIKVLAGSVDVSTHQLTTDH
jgi:hypothetical protein